MALLEGITRRLALEPHERRTLLVMGALVATLMCAYTVAKVLRDALFLTEFEGLALPYAYIGVALASAGFVWLETRVLRRYTSVAASYFSQYVAIAFSAAAAIVFPHAPHRTAAAFYLWTGSQAMLLLPHFWLLALEVWDSRRARILFPLFGGCGLLGGAIGGAFGGWSLPLLRRVGLMWILAGLLLLAHLLTRLLQRHRGRRPSPAFASSAGSPWSIIRSSRYLQVFALGLGLAVIVATLVDFQFKLVLQQVYPDTPALTRFLGKFYVALNIAALLFQFGLAGWLMERFGLTAGTALQPTAVMMFAPVVAVGGGWWAIVALRWVQGVVFQTLGKPATEIYYAAIRPNVRRRIKPALDTLTERWSDAFVGVLLIVLLHILRVPVTAIAVGTGLVAAVWAFVLFRLNRYYGQAFQKVLSSRWLEPDEGRDVLRMPAARKALFEALAGDDERAMVLALELCSGVRDAAIARATYACLRRPSAAVVRAALAAMEASRIPDPERIADGLLRHAEASVRREAVGYLLVMSRRPVALARELLQREDRELSQDVVDALFERPEVAPGAVTSEWIDARLSAGTEHDLLLAARGLGSMRGAPALQRLQKLLVHPNVEIRRATLLSFTRRPNRAALGALVDLLLDPDLALEAREAVAALGDDAVPALRALLQGSRGPAGQSAAGRALAHIASARAIRALAPLARSAEVHVRHLGLASLTRARVRAGRPILPRRLAHRLFLRELRDYRRERDSGALQRGSELPEVRLLAESFRESADMALERGIAALSCWYDPTPLTGVLERLVSVDRAQAAPALEYLGHVLPRGVFRPVSRVFESNEVQEPGETSRLAALPELIEAAWDSGDAWLRACAVRAARYVPNLDLGRFATDDHPLVRAELEARGLPAAPAARTAAC